MERIWQGEPVFRPVRAGRDNRNEFQGFKKTGKRKAGEVPKIAQKGCWKSVNLQPWVKSQLYSPQLGERLRDISDSSIGLSLREQMCLRIVLKLMCNQNKNIKRIILLKFRDIYRPQSSLCLPINNPGRCVALSFMILK